MAPHSDKYRLGERIGGGGMAEVFRATKLGVEGFARPVAIKRMLPALSADDKFAEMFVNEARLASLLLHPNIVAVLDFDRDDQGRLFIVMELVDGKDLRHLAASGPLPIPVSAFIVSQVLRALAYAHELTDGGRPLGMVHRDVSPHNVLLSWDGAVKLSDFGIAKAMGASGASRTGTLKGKVGYMSPEQAHGLPLDGRSDVFAVGIMFHELLTGRRLFGGATEAEVLSRMLAQPIASPRALNPDVPEDVAAACLGMLERDRDRRFASARAALEALLNCDVISARAQLDLADLMAARFPGEAPVRDESGPVAAIDAAATAAARPAAMPAAAMDAPTRTASPGERAAVAATAVLPGARAPAASSGSGTPTAAGERVAPPGSERTAAVRPGRPARRAGLAIGAVAAAAVGAVVVAGALKMTRDPSGDARGARAGAPVATAAAGDAVGPAAHPAATGATAAGPVAVVPAAPDAGPAAARADSAAAPSDAGAVAPDDHREARRGHRRRKGGRTRVATGGHAGSPKPTAADPARAAADDSTARPTDIATADQLGELYVKVQPWANVRVDGHGSKITPARWALPPGRYRVRIWNEELPRSETITVTVSPGEVQTVVRDWK
ncbi:MAG: hypothetical protein D6689_00785 [Deltaproteobacteria bacterium]|nr:MAG: hypothetical protein D6689_00785 [Deltaproteobacteria bacterium]